MPTPVAVTKAVAAMRSAENGALARSAANEESLYTGSGREPQNKTKVKGKKKRFAALIIILGLFVGGGTFLGSSNSLLMGALENIPTEATNTQNASNLKRTSYLLRFMSAGKPKSVTWPTSGFPTTLLNRMAKNGITSSKSGNTTTLFFKGMTINESNYHQTYMENAAFRDAIESSRMGKVASFFDNIAEKFYSLRNMTRNWLKGSKTTGNTEVDTQTYNDNLAKEFDNNSTSKNSGKSPMHHWETETDEDGNIIWEGWVEDPPLNDTTTSSTSASSTAEVDAQAKSYISRIAGTISNAISTGCGIYRVGNLIAMTVAANSMYQAAQSFMKFMESISKTMAGDGDSAMINEALNKVSATVTTTNEAGEEVTGSALESTGLQLVLGAAYTTLGLTAASSVSRTYSNERAMSSLFGNGHTLNACAGSDIANSAISLAVTLGGGVAGIVGGVVVRIFGTAVLSGVASALLGFLIPAVSSLFVNAAIATVGKPFGESLMNGFSLNMLLSMKSGLSLATETTVAQHNKLSNEVLALEAEVDRMKHSPFDITNKNTFFGSIAYSLLPTFTSSKTVNVTSLLRTTSTSIASLTGRVSADGENTSYITTFGECHALESIGAVGDIYCNPISVIDTSTINLEPDDPTYQEVISSQIDSTTNEINDDSDLAKYITYCNSRISPFGVADASILSDLHYDNGIIDALSSLPVVGDVINILNATEDIANSKWATGEKCVNDGSAEWNNEFRYYQRYVEDQRLLEQMGAYEGSKNPVTAYEERYEASHPLDNTPSGYLARITGMSKDNAELVLALADYTEFIEDYDAETRIALDNTLTPTGAEIAAAAKAESEPKFHTNSNTEHPLLARSHYIVYADIRNRSYAA